jgi:hypothetical protein
LLLGLVVLKVKNFKRCSNICWTITAPSYAIYGGLGTQFLKADGSTDSTSYATLGDITGTALQQDLNLVVV